MCKTRTILLVVIIALTVLGCQKSIDDKLIGKWTRSTEYKEYTIEFLSSGDFLLTERRIKVQSFLKAQKKGNTTEAKWSLIDKDRLKLYVVSFGTERAEFSTVSFDNNVLVLKKQNGKINRYTRYIN